MALTPRMADVTNSTARRPPAAPAISVEPLSSRDTHLDHRKRGGVCTVLRCYKLREIEREHSGLIHTWYSRAVFTALGNSPSRSIAFVLPFDRAMGKHFFSHLLL